MADGVDKTREDAQGTVANPIDGGALTHQGERALWR
jgi:hypothetical protein